MRESILIVDDESGVRASLAGILGDEGYFVQAVESGEDCLQALEGRRYDLLLLDVWLPRMDGLETLSRVRTLDPELPVIVISGHGNIETAVKAVRDRKSTRLNSSHVRISYAVSCLNNS